MLISFADRKASSIGGPGRGRGGRNESTARRQAKGNGRGIEDVGAKGRGKEGPGAKSGGKGMKCPMQGIHNFILLLLKYLALSMCVNLTEYELVFVAKSEVLSFMLKMLFSLYTEG